MSNQRYELSRPFPESYVEKKGEFGDFVNHAVITQRLLEVCGSYNFFVKEIIYDEGGLLTGCVVKLEVYVDGEYQVIEEVGAVERPQINNAENLKHAISDGSKRVCMRIGLGLHLWAQDKYFLDKKLDDKNVGGNTMMGETRKSNSHPHKTDTDNSDDALSSEDENSPYSLNTDKANDDADSEELIIPEKFQKYLKDDKGKDANT